MELTSERQVEVTRVKLQLLEERVAASLHAPDANSYVNQASRRSLKRMINQMKEEIARFEAKAALPKT